MIIAGSWNRVLSLDLCRWHPKSRAIIVAGAPPRYPCGGGRRTAAMYVPGAYLWQRGAGAIDIIVVRQQNGFFKSSPWNVRFSRLQGEVELQVNGVPALFRMLLNPNGDAYFPNPNPESDLSTNSDTNPSTNPNTNPNPSTNTNPSANPSTKPNTKSNPKTNPNLSSNPSTNPNTNPNLSTNPNTNPNLSTNPNTNPNPSTNPSTSPNTNPNPIVNPNPSANPKTNPNPSGNPKTNSSTNPITNPNPNANPSTDVSSNIKPSTNPISNINPNPSSSPSTNPDTNRTTNPSTDPDINPNPNTDPKPNHGPEWLPELKKLTSFESAEIVVDLLDTWSTGNPKQDGKKLQPSTRDVTIGKEKVGDHEKNSAEIVRDLNPTAEPYTLLEDLAVLLSQIAEENASAEEMQREIMALKDESVSETVPTIPTSTEEATPEMVLLSVDGHVLTAPVSDGIELVSNPKIGDAETVLNSAEPLQNGLIGLENLPNAVLYSSPPSPADFYDAIAVGDSATSLSEELLEGLPQTMDSIGNSSKKNADKSNAALWTEDLEGIGNKLLSTGLEISLCRHLLQEGMGLEAASEAFSSRKVSLEEFSASGRAILASDQLVARIGSRYFPWMEVAPAIIGTLAFSTKFASHTKEGLIPVQSKEAAEGGTLVPVRSNWLSWSFPFRKPANNNLSLETPSPQFADNLSRKTGLYKYGWRSEAHLYVPTSEQLASLNLREGENKITFTVSIGVLGKQQQVDARIYLWNWNTRIVISDVDGTITKSDVLGHVMPLVGRDWSQLGVTRLFSAIKENGYEILFLSARAITQACGTRQFLLNLKQDGEMLPQGPVVISPDGLFPSLYREVIRRAPHEFKISYLKEIRELFPVDINPFYAGFGNRQTDEISYLQVGVPKGKIFIINPKGEVVVNHRVDVKSYTSLHTLVNDMFPAMSTSEQEDFNSWNYWKMPLPDIKDEIVKLRRPRKK